MTSCPGRVWVRTEIRLPCVPEDTNSAASLPMRRAACSSSRRTVGSSSHTSSPTSARAMASRMPGVGRVNVSERRSTISCTDLPGGHGLESLRRPAPPFRVSVVGGALAEGIGGFLGTTIGGVYLAQAVEGLGNDEGPRVVLDHVLEPLTGAGGIPLIQI